MNEKQKKVYLTIFFLFLPGSLLLFFSPASAQNPTRTKARQVYLTFRYKGAVNSVITAYYKDGQFYLPVITLFEQLGIDYQYNAASLSVSGFYLNVGTQYRLHFLSENHYAAFEGERYKLPFKSFLVKKLDFYLLPAKFEQIFGLNFAVNFNALNLELKTDKTMPAVAALKRKRQRERIQELSFGHEGYPLIYERDRSWLAGAFLDYTFSANITSGANVYTYGFNLGAEALGGDVQGQIFGSYSTGLSNFQVNNLRYHFVTDRKNDYLTQITAGQLLSDGLISNSVLGVSITNEPVVPRVLFDSYIVNGTTIPGSEVELYLNNALVGFQIADGLGNYRFKVPLTYGSSRIRVKIYGPGGQIIKRAERIDIPFNFLPAGEVNYKVTAGRLNNPVLGISDSSLAVQGTVSAGLTNWLSATFGTDYYSSDRELPIFYGQLSGRFFTNYNLSAKIAPQAFYKITGTAIYPSSVSWRLSYTYFNEEQGLYNILGNNRQLRGSIFVPLSVGSIPFNIRLFADRQFRDIQNLTRYRLSLNTRIKRFNLRFGFRDTKIGRFTLQPSPVSELTASATYNISRRDRMPSFLRGSYLRATASYSPYFTKLEQIEFNISRPFLDDGYIQLSFAHNFIGKFNVIGLNFSFDFKHVRTNASFRRIRDNFITTNTLRGSVGFDPYRNKLLFMNRQQAGRAGASFRLYVDENSSGKYNKGEKLITENPIRLKRYSGAFLEKDSLIYLTQLRPYDRYDVNIYKGVIKNPLLVPSIEKFSFIADPNRYKPIDIPFFMSGVISGKVALKRDSTRQPVSGLHIIVEEKGGEFHKILRTFTDGSFYSYEIPPGKYVVQVDSSQLAFLDAKPTPAKITFSVEAKPRGDFIEGLNFTLIPIKETKETKEKPAIQSDRTQIQPKKEVEPTKPDKIEERYRVQFASFSTLKKAAKVYRYINEKLGEPAHLIFNPKTDLYGIRSSKKYDLLKALHKTLSLLKSADKLQPILIQTKKAKNAEIKVRKSDFEVRKLVNPSFAFSIVMEFSSSLNRSKISKVIEDTIGGKVAVQYNGEAKRVKIEGLQGWSKTLQLQQRLLEKTLLHSSMIIWVE